VGAVNFLKLHWGSSAEPRQSRLCGLGIVRALARGGDGEGDTKSPL